MDSTRSPEPEPDRKTVRVLVADDHAVFRKGLADLIRDRPQLELVGEANDGLEAVEMTRQLRPDVVVMDVSMPRLDGLEATRRIRAEWPQIRVLGLSMYEDDQMLRAMREAGSTTCLTKTDAPDRLIDTIWALAQVSHGQAAW